MVLKFERESSIELSRDLNAKFNPQYVFSINIEDIDSNVILGDIARPYEQTLEKLRTKGLSVSATYLICFLYKTHNKGVYKIHLIEYNSISYNIYLKI